MASGLPPKRIIIGFVKNAASRGTIKENPFNFQHFDLNYLSLSIGSQSIPSQPLTPNFDRNQYLKAYMTLFEGVGILNGIAGHGIKRGQLKNG